MSLAFTDSLATSTKSAKSAKLANGSTDVSTDVAKGTGSTRLSSSDSPTPATTQAPSHQRRPWYILLPLIVNLIAYIVMFPGVDSPDAVDQRKQYATWTFNKQHSILDTFFLGFVARNQLWLSNLLQMLIFSGCIIVALAVLARRVSRRALLVATLLFSFYPLFPAYSISCTKDVLCAGFTLLLCVEVFEAIDTKGKILRRPWFLAGLAVTLFLTNEFRKNNFIFVFAIIIYLLIHFRRYWRQLVASLVAFAALSAAWGTYCDYGLKAKPSPTTEMLGVPLMQVSYIYYQDLHGSPQHLSPQANAYFTSIRPESEWARNYDIERLFVMTNKVPSLTGKDLRPFLKNWSDLCFSNLGTCVAGYAKFEGSLVNPLQVTDDQYSILAAMLHTDKGHAVYSKLAPIPHVIFNLAILDWVMIALAVFAWRRGMHELLPLFLIPLGIGVSLMLSALAVQIRLMLGSIILIPFLAALVFGREKRDGTAKIAKAD
ncbi:DUF6020 family protein [Bifidobacterium sp. ESL0790]|uniref:DUF6020 family protein n=1 Tax=Bifidobacterium sp. ESL0790 TaxID=2983233 RepID=UPI0023F719FA|nr:DUF6020 family protein [Bifidobacterium sp. ESL0790]WEV72685.1 DUF6020 family protein [Bifidobacterium sp. ESL0790]